MAVRQSSDHGEYEIEITPEMIEAGAQEFYAHDSRFESGEDTVRDIFAAMLEAGSLVKGQMRNFAKR